MPGTRWFAIGVAVAAASAGVAMAASRSAETTPVTADFRAALTSQQQRACGESHTKFRVTFWNVPSAFSGPAKLDTGSTPMPPSNLARESRPFAPT